MVYFNHCGYFKAILTEGYFITDIVLFNIIQVNNVVIVCCGIFKMEVTVCSQPSQTGNLSFLFYFFKSLV